MFSGLPKFDKLCQNLTNYVKFYQILSNFVQFCIIFVSFTEMFSGITPCELILIHHINITKKNIAPYFFFIIEQSPNGVPFVYPNSMLYGLWTEYHLHTYKLLLATTAYIITATLSYNRFRHRQALTINSTHSQLI